jgi:proline iminopeptidase
MAIMALLAPGALSFTYDPMYCSVRSTSNGLFQKVLTLSSNNLLGSYSTKSGSQPQEGYINVTGGKVWYRATGIDKKGIPLIIIHGGPGAPHDYLEPLEVLSNERPVIFYDQLGCGNSDTPCDPSLWTMERLIEELGQVREALGLDRVHILGQSWGTMIAVDYILTKGSKGVISLVLSGPCLSAPRFVSDQREYLRQLPEDVKKVILESEASGNFSSKAYQDAMMTYYRLHVCRMNPWPDCLNRTFEKLAYKMYEYMWGPSEFTTTGTLRDYDLSDRLEEIMVPVLFTCGRYNECTPSTASYYGSMLPGSEVVVFEDASHEHHLEKTAEYLVVVRDFLKKSESRM